jgi:hypothetical protein
MDAFAATFKTIDAGLKTSREFTNEQRFAAIRHLQAQGIQKPTLRLNNETVVVVAMRSKSHSAVVSVKLTDKRPAIQKHWVVAYEEAGIDLPQQDFMTIAKNLTATEAVGESEMACEGYYPMSMEWNNHWLSELVRVLSRDGKMNSTLAANAGIAFSYAWNSLMATLMMDAMEETEEEGMRLCYANRAKLFHAHAEQTRLVLDTTWLGAMEMKLVMV